MLQVGMKLSNRLVGVDDLAMILWAASGYQEDVLDRTVELRQQVVV